MNRPEVQKKHSNIMKRLHESGKIPYFKTGKDNPAYGKIFYPKAEFIDELGHIVRSSWEKNVADILIINNIKYQYESTKFKLDDKTYTPDFETDKVFIEVKGPMYDWQLNKYKDFKPLIEKKKKYIMLVDKSYVKKVNDLGFVAYDIKKPELWLKELQ